MSDNVIAITGGTGFVGRHLVKRLVDEGRRVRLLVRSPSAAQELFADLDVETASGDLDNLQALRELTAGAGTVIHLAS
ncbi:MAG: NAD-dependent epimerase/dehydratase family protein, partial [Pseudomonadota bacterium]